MVDIAEATYKQHLPTLACSFLSMRHVIYVVEDSRDRICPEILSVLINNSEEKTDFAHRPLNEPRVCLLGIEQDIRIHDGYTIGI